MRHCLVSFRTWFIFIGLVAFSKVTYSQCPVPDFVVQSSICIGEGANFNNSSSNSNSYHWDFCGDDLLHSPSAVNTSTPGNLSQPFGYKTILVNGNYYGFLTSRGNSRLFRLNFGNDLKNTPTYTDLGNPGGLLNQPEDIDMIEVDGKWYAIIVLNLNAPDNKLVLLDFGSNIETSNPTASFFGNFGITTKIRGASVVFDGSRIILAISNSLRDIYIINFRNSFSNSISAEHIRIVPNIVSANGIFALDIYRECSNWYIFAASFSNGNIHRLKFGTDIFTAPLQIDTYTIAGIVQPFDIDIVEEGGRVFGLVSNLGQPYRLISFGELALNPSPVTVSTGNPGSIVATKSDITKYENGYVLHGIDQSIRELNIIRYVNNTCGASLEYSLSANPPAIKYANSGNHKIVLRTFSNNVSVDRAKALNVSTAQAPDIDFSIQNICANHDVNFTPENSSGNISNYSWNFGDGNASALENPVHQFNANGDYAVTLQVGASNGCQNLVSKMIKIYNAPLADFNIPAGLLCTNQEYVFDNSSIVDPGYQASWQWEINGVQESVEEDLRFAFASNSSFEVKLRASIPGCESEIVKSINSLEEGPTIDFLFDGFCQDYDIEFINSSSGDIIEYYWQFGDGEESDEISPTHQYRAFGNFNVTLQASSPNGCQNSTTKPITIYSKPQPNFQLVLPPFSCSGTPSQFTDTTPGPPDSNLTTWQWNFGNDGSPQNTSTLRNPQHTYMNAGNYNVTLTAGTNYGCQETIAKQVTIAQTPIIEIVNTPACKDQPVTFTANSQEPLKSWNWQTGIVQYTIAQPTHLYAAAGSFSMNLNAVGQNDCIASASKNIVIPQPLVPDFAVEKNCVGQAATFSDETTVLSDPIAAWNWNFAGLGSGSGSPATHTFQSTGSQNVALQITTASGCVYTASKNVVIVNAPQANFVANPEVGVPPLLVQFTNTSTNATHYLWNFNDPAQTTSTQLSPQFTFNEFGNHVVDLTAYNTQNCSHTFTKIIRAETPVVEVQLLDLILAENPAGTLMVEVVIRNNGNAGVQNLPISIDLSGITVQQTVPGFIGPNATGSHLLSFNVLKGTKLEYICVRVDIPHDIVPENNVLCKPTESATVVFAPYPNPAKELVQIDWIAEENQSAIIGIHDALGRTFVNYTVSSNAGFNSSPLHVTGLDPGVYFIVFQSGSIRRTYRILVWR